MLELHGTMIVSHVGSYKLIFLYHFLIEVGKEEFSNYEERSFLGILVRLGPFPWFFRQVKEWQKIRLPWNDKCVICGCLSSCTYFLFWSRSERRIVQTYKKWSFLGILGNCGPSQNFQQVKVQIKLISLKIARVCFIFACPIVFAFPWDRSRQGEVPKLKKND